MTKKNIKKFLFDKHNFDPPDPDEIGPPLIYTEEDFQHAVEKNRDLGHKTGYEEGLTTALEQSKTLVERDISQKIDELLVKVDMLSEQELARQKLFEEEVVSVVLKVIDKTLPMLSEKFATDELYSFIQSVLEAQKEVSGQVEMQATSVTIEQVKPRIEELIQQRGYQLKLIYTEKEHLEDNDIIMRWQDGGAEKYFNHSVERVVKAISTFYVPKEEVKNEPKTQQEEEKPLETDGDTP